MPDTVVRIYLYVLIFLNLLFPVIYLVLWLAQSQRPRQPLVKAKLLWRDLFFLISGLVGWYFFVSRLLNSWLVMTITLVTLVVSTYAAELMERAQLKRVEDKRAA